MKVKELIEALKGVDGEMEVELFIDTERSYTIAIAESAYVDDDCDTPKFIISGDEDEDFCP